MELGTFRAYKMAIGAGTTAKIAILKEVCELLSVGREIDASIVQRLRTALYDYQNNNAHNIFNPKSQTFTTKAKSVRDLTRDINAEFEEISNNDFSLFKLSIGKDAVIRFLKNSDGKGQIVGVDTKNSSIRLIAAFLALPDIGLINLKDIEEKKLAYPEARYFKRFMQSDVISEANINLNSLDGVYISEREEDERYTRISLNFRMSADNAHLIVDENYLKETYSGAMKKVSFGWGMITDHNVLHVALRRVEGFAHTYQSIGLPSKLQKQIDNLKEIKEIKEIALQRFEETESYNDSSTQSRRKDLIKLIDSNLFIFEKNANVLTFPKGNDDKSEDTVQDIDPFWGDFKSANLAEDMERNNIMDEAERERLSQQLIHAAAYSGCPDEIIDRLEQGASVNYQDPKTGCTVMHLIAGGANLVLYQNIIDSAQDEIDPLIRDKQGHLPSLYALDNNELVDIIRGKEISAAAKQGYYPGVTPASDKKLEVPDGPGM